MALLTNVTVETAEQNVANVMNGFAEAVGEVPKPLFMLANSPGLFMQQAAVIGYYRDHAQLEHGLLTCIRYLAAYKLGYQACIDFNGNLLQRMGLTEADLTAMVKDPSTAPLSEKETTLLQFVCQGLEDPDSGKKGDIDTLKRLGWQESDIVDAVNMGFGMAVHGRMLRYFQMEK